MTKAGKRVVVAMSGGVDSSVAAAMLTEQGYDVVGLSMQLWDRSGSDAESGAATRGSCCSLEDLYDARRVADSLGIPFYVVNMEGLFSREVVGYFVRGYLSGMTPNPCVKCNEVMKFQGLMRKAMELEADFLATGHYARIEGDGGGYRLLKAVDASKDQSYFLFTMNQSELGRVLFPLGGLTKKDVRAHAASLGLRVAGKDESQEICFVDNGGYGDFIAGIAPELSAEGEITDAQGNVLGMHRGLFRYTVGQRKGLDIRDGSGPYYVTGMDMERNRLIVGGEGGLFSKGLFAGGLNWINRAPVSGKTLTAKIRYRHPGAECTVRPAGDGMEVFFATPEKAVTPGQAIVFYSGDEVMGGGWIERAI